MLSILSSLFFCFSIVCIPATIHTQENKQKTTIKTIYIVNATGKKIRAIFKPVTTIIETGTIEQVCFDPDQPTKENNSDEFIIQSTSYSMEFGLCLNADQEVQKIVLEQKQLGTKDLFEGVLDWSTATTCTLILYDNEEERIIKKDFMISDGVTYEIRLEHNQLIVKEVE